MPKSGIWSAGTWRLVKAPAGPVGRLSKSLTLEQAQELLGAATGSRLDAYVVFSVTT